MREGVQVLAPEGDATIERAQELKESLIAGFEGADSVALDFSRVTSVDLTAIHLIYAARRHADRTGKTFNLIGDLSPDVADAFLIGGFTKRNVSDGEELEKSLVDFGDDGIL